MKNSCRQKGSLEIWRESRSRNTLVCLSLCLNLVILYQCLPLAGPYQKREPGQTHSKGQETDAERIRETGEKKKKKKGKKLASSRAYAYLQGLLGDLLEINRISAQAKQLAYNGSSEYVFFSPLHSSLSPFSLIKICCPETDSFVA